MNVCRYQRHWRLDSNKIHIFDLMIESRNWSFLHIYNPMPWQAYEVQSAFNIQVQLSCCGWFIENIWWLANLFVLNLAFGWKNFLQIEKWAKCHLLLKCGLKTSTYDIWFLCALFASNFLFSKAFMGYLWVSLILLDLFLISHSYSLIWVFGWCSC